MKFLQRYTFLFCFFFAGLQFHFGQHAKKMDSLNLLLNSAKQDTTRLQLYFELANECEVKDNLMYAQPAVELCDKLIQQSKNEQEKIKYLRKKADAISFVSFYYQDRQDFDKRVDLQKKRVAIYQQINDTMAALNTQFEIADLYRFAGNLPKAFEYFQKGLAYSEKLDHKKGIARFLAELGDMYSDQGDTAQAVQMYKRMLSIAKQVNEKRFLAITTLKVGGLYNAMGQYDIALNYYKQSGNLFEEFKDIHGRLDVYKNTGDTYKAKGNYEMALQNYEKAVQVGYELQEPIYQINMMSRIAQTYADMKDFKSALDVLNKAMVINNNITRGGNMTGWINYSFAKVYFKQKEFKKAKTCIDLSIQLILNSNSIEIRKDAESLATRIDSACGDFKGAYFHHIKYMTLSDQMNSEEIKKAATKEKYQAEYDKQKAIDKAEQEKKDLKAADEKRQQQLVIWSVVFGLLLVLAFAGYIMRSLNLTRKQKQIIELKEKETAEQKHLLEEKQKEIIDSITYARRIQRALITNEKYIDKSLNKLQNKKI